MAYFQPKEQASDDKSSEALAEWEMRIVMEEIPNINQQLLQLQWNRDGTAGGSRLE